MAPKPRPADMQTQLIDAATDAPHLEYFPPASSRPQRTVIAEFPFSIGRNETADLTIDSTRVSRQHAVIERFGGGFRVRDMGSTNGTILNGRRISESVLVDGDVLTIADVEFNFCCATDQARATATQIMNCDAEREDVGRSADRMVAAVRRLHETVLSGDWIGRFTPVRAVSEGHVSAYRATVNVDGDDLFHPSPENRLLSADCRLNARLRNLAQLQAIERAAGLPEGAPLVVPAASADVTTLDPARFIDRLQLLCDDRPLVLAVAASEAAGAVAFLEACRSANVGTAVFGFSGESTDAESLKEGGFEFVFLDSQRLKGLSPGSARFRPLHRVVELAKQVGSQVVATGVEPSLQKALCDELRLELVEGELIRE